jgi:hypothetical protein
MQRCDAHARRLLQSIKLGNRCYVQLAAPLVKLGRIEEAKLAGSRAMELQSAFRFSRQFAGVDCEPKLAASLSEALFVAGLPE